MVQVEAFFANPQVEVEQDDGDIGDGRHYRAQQRTSNLNERGLKVAGAEEGRDHAEQDEEAVSDDQLHDPHNQQDAERPPPGARDEVPAASQAPNRTNVLGHHRRQHKRPADGEVDGGAKHREPREDQQDKSDDLRDEPADEHQEAQRDQTEKWQVTAQGVAQHRADRRRPSERNVRDRPDDGPQADGKQEETTDEAQGE